MPTSSGLGTKELRSFLHFVLLGLVIYGFLLAIMAQAQSNSQEVHNASVGIVDEHHSKHNPAIQLDGDATAMVQARLPLSPVNLVVRLAFNPSVETGWFTSVREIINSIATLAVVLAGAAVIRERRTRHHEPSAVMPLTPFEDRDVQNLGERACYHHRSRPISLLYCAGCAWHSNRRLDTTILVGAATYLFFATAIGIFLGTIARSMPQLGLLYLLVYLPLAMLSGANTPLESMPHWLATMMQVSPTVYFVSFARAILYLGAGFGVVWREIAFVSSMGGLFLRLALLRFRRVVSAVQ